MWANFASWQDRHCKYLIIHRKGIIHIKYDEETMAAYDLFGLRTTLTMAGRVAKLAHIQLPTH